MGGPPAENAEHIIIRKVRIARFGGMRLPEKSAAPAARPLYLHFSWRVLNTAVNFCPSEEFGSTCSSPSIILA